MVHRGAGEVCQRRLHAVGHLVSIGVRGAAGEPLRPDQIIAVLKEHRAAGPPEAVVCDIGWIGVEAVRDAVPVAVSLKAPLRGEGRRNAIHDEGIATGKVIAAATPPRELPRVQGLLEPVHIIRRAIPVFVRHVRPIRRLGVRRVHRQPLPRTRVTAAGVIGGSRDVDRVRAEGG